MTITLEIPQDLADILLEQAEERGLTIEQWILELLVRIAAEMPVPERTDDQAGDVAV